MIRSSRRGAVRRRIMIAAVAALVPVIAGCEAGSNAPTLQWHQPTDGTLAYAGPGKSITIADVFVLGAPIGAVLHRGQSAGMFFGLVNTGSSADRLIAVSAPGTALTVKLPAGGVPLSKQSRILLTGPKPAVVLQNLVKPLRGGSVIKIYLIFKNAGLVKLFVPVMPMASNYVTYLPPAPVSPTGTLSAHPTTTFKRVSASPSPSSSR